jgi:hypothetical protein
MEAGTLNRPPSLMLINGGGYLILTASINLLTEVVLLSRPPVLLD